MAELTAQRCEACTGETPRLLPEEMAALSREIEPEWTVVDGGTLFRRFKFKNFVSAFAFAGRVAELAEQEGHHPDLRVGWGYLEVETTTHAIGGLSRNDYILAAKIDSLDRENRASP